MFNYVANFSRVHDKIDSVRHFHNIFNNFIGFLKTLTTVSQRLLLVIASHTS